MGNLPVIPQREQSASLTHYSAACRVALIHLSVHLSTIRPQCRTKEMLYAIEVHRGARNKVETCASVRKEGGNATEI